MHKSLKVFDECHPFEGKQMPNVLQMKGRNKAVENRKEDLRGN